MPTASSPARAGCLKPIFDGLREHLPDTQILELTYITCLYSQHAVMSKALRTEFDNVDERVVEVTAPDDFDPRDIVRDISGPDRGRADERLMMDETGSGSDAGQTDAGEEE